MSQFCAYSMSLGGGNSKAMDDAVTAAIKVFQYSMHAGYMLLPCARAQQG